MSIYVKSNHDGKEKKHYAHSLAEAKKIQQDEMHKGASSAEIMVNNKFLVENFRGHFINTFEKFSIMCYSCGHVIVGVNTIEEVGEVLDKIHEVESNPTIQNVDSSPHEGVIEKVRFTIEIDHLNTIVSNSNEMVHEYEFIYDETGTKIMGYEGE